MYQVINGIIHMSVRNLVEFILRSGDLDNRRGSYKDKKAMAEGSRIHRSIQHMMGSLYRAEVPLKHLVDCGKYSVELEGRADGIFENTLGITTIDEIKSMYLDVTKFEKPVEVHKAQAMCYAYIFALQNEKDTMVVRMTYCNIETMATKYFEDMYTFEELEEWFAKVISELTKWCDYLVEHRESRNLSIPKTPFPYEYRKGQRQLVVSAYRTMEQKKKLFVQAPTGIGKTLSAVYPAVQAVGQGYGEKIFYLTAKTITRKVAQEAFELLCRKGLNYKAVSLTAKEKMCCLKSPDCNPESCPYAAGYFDRINDAVYDLVTHYQVITREDIMSMAEKYQVCPFEMSLDVTYWVDAIICDYNYVFDPNVRLQRYFADETKGEYLFLVDEAHNLVDRARSMYSATLVKEDFLEAKKILEPINHKLASMIQKCNKALLDMRRECVDEFLEVTDHAGVDLFTMQLRRVYEGFEHFFEDNPNFRDDTVLTFYFAIRQYLMIYEAMDDSYIIYTEIREDDSFALTLFCVHPANLLKQCMHQGNATVLFSATMLPINYYKELLGAEEGDYAVYVNSPFDPEKRLLGITTDISTVYRRRSTTEYQKIAEYLFEISKKQKGNYMAFFPSYRFMEDVGECLELLLEKEHSDTGLMYQQNNMTELEREEYLEEFSRQKETSVIGMCVMGGIFSEGIDLTEDKLIGVMIVGTGLPQVCPQRELLKRFFDRRGKRGFDFAYLYPGINKVLQSAGRLIRTDDDYGVIALMDDRFMKREYIEQFPVEWNNCRVWGNKEQMISDLSDYWRKL